MNHRKEEVTAQTTRRPKPRPTVITTAADLRHRTGAALSRRSHLLRTAKEGSGQRLTHLKRMVE
ncbi:MAG TPA: hypothetical protein VNM72_14130 [Blastocatellia bacterium]|nr:hypothetical protein [Blastocatellia bacterium]